MKVAALILLLVASVVILYSPAGAQQKASGIVQEREQTTEAKIDKSEASPEFRRILEAEEKAHAQIAELQQQMLSLDGDQLAELERKAEQVKKDAQIEILKIRLEIARTRGDSRNVQEIEKTLEQLQNPPPVEEEMESKALREAWEKENRETDKDQEG
jgi:hypothetical protein